MVNLSSGSFIVHCAAGSNSFNVQTDTPMYGSFPTNTNNCVFNIINHGVKSNTVDNVSSDGANTFYIHSQIEQNISVKFFEEIV